MKLEHIKSTYTFIDKLLDQNLGVYIVGGYVRDHILNKENKDIDFLVTGISINNLESLLKTFDLKVDNVGASFGVLKLKNIDIDIAVPRKETKVSAGYTGFEVETENVTLEEDLFRRDYTINSIAISLKDGSMIDPYNGLIDLENKIIRMTNPNAFIEDPLRMLRAIQFASRFKFTIEEETFRLIKANAKLIKEISGERIVIELDKIFTKGDHKIGFDLLVQSGLLFEINTYFPGYRDGDDLPRMDLIDEIKTKGDFYFVLFNSRPIDFFENVLKLDTQTIYHVNILRTISDGHFKWSSIECKREVIFEFVSRDKDFLNTGTSYMRTILNEFRAGMFPMKISDLALNGHELMSMGYKGKEIGNAQKFLLQNIFSGETNDKETLKRLLIKK